MAKSKKAAQQPKGKRADSKKAAYIVRPVGPDVTNGGRTIIARNGGGPSVTPSASGGVRVKNTERMGQVQVAVPGVFERTGYNFNPASSLACPWLSNIAKNYSLFRVHKLEFSYTPFVPTTTGGEVIMGVFYDEEDAANYVATGNQQTLALQSEFVAGPVFAGGAMSSSEGARTSYFGVKSDVAMAHTRYPWFIVDSTTVAGPGRNLSVPISLGWGVISSTAGVQGTIYMTYDIEFIKPTGSN